MTINQDYWRHYYDAETAAQGDVLRQEMTLQSTGVAIHLDLYKQPDRTAPVLIINHGGGGYSRMFLPLALALYRHGYTVIAPDQRGQGYSEGDRGDFTIDQFVQNIIDVTCWARACFSGPLYLLGGSVGGGLVYNAAAVGGSVDAVICHNLYDFGSIHDTLALSRFAPLRHIPGLAASISLFIRGLAKMTPGLHLPFRALARFKEMVDERDVRFFSIWKEDPLPIRWVTLRYIKSTFTTPPCIPFEANTLPILVINPIRDRMVSPTVTRCNYERLGGSKQYAEIAYGHWATGDQFIHEYVGILDAYLQKIHWQS